MPFINLCTEVTPTTTCYLLQRFFTERGTVRVDARCVALEEGFINKRFHKIAVTVTVMDACLHISADLSTNVNVKNKKQFRTRKQLQ